ncbi:hypothetical protein A3H10_05220 [Candidatus Uhrbacteria bacterium RIFCSPLOWO2_12_FULL_46_10]|uniref:Solute-binding protein family 5 domain-containing protein n=1 Tax=Candidatus Uhrbacteria bacterium RIFCSPLOWO2_01_FULL_47_25 TaxID=1802402 RepID=A0A1F7UY42_9BACT|nr:MAG: hypothetical protein A2752_03790 [Candidatus Uhrbacteria bacterium RIFCSPHIGHO2_01_FULL_46_23]OGL69738.1 MAG: hypothetical protein A3D60_05165 [Candidatus Uhrbacteria bacterium RIFCSPHIGHO2_02_FULL_47_29]OGL76568.1 MAG: hypothetical protein A3E96_04145 [Candidatus Uhrbacteria bacterium RIFCSPHIGHO2_12_FULL_46_13]OGL83193.1 MAG: hypothetical protein A2936_04630 [Candidatus Uhrbacteria bacterium RIFCSPLOWO2_01_FULL_47_25]OGL85852.1 MAG: hypothetical protein A3I37_04145 [Candidatus Uhrbact
MRPPTKQDNIINDDDKSPLTPESLTPAPRRGGVRGSAPRNHETKGDTGTRPNDPVGRVPPWDSTETFQPEADATAEQQSLPVGWRDKLKRFLNLSGQAIRSTADLERQLIFSLNPKKWPTLKQLRHCGRIFTKLEKKILTGCAIVIVVAAMWLVSSRLLAHIVALPARGGSYTEALIGQPEFINPIFAANSAVDNDLTRLIFSGLFRYNENLGIELDLAESYTISADGRIYTVTLREGLNWHNNEPLTADDVVFTFASISDPDVKSPLRPSFRNIAIEKIDERTVRFTLKDPYKGFLNLLATGIIPEHIWEEVPRDQWRGRTENIQPIGNGPWQFNSLERDSNGNIKLYILNPADTIGQEDTARPFIDRLTFKFYPDETQAFEALGNQSVEGLSMISQSSAAQLKGNKQLTIRELKLRANTVIFFNLNQSSPIEDVTVRRALKNAIDKRRLVTEVFINEAMIIGNQMGGQNGKDVAAKEDPEALLNKAGWEEIGAIRKNKKGETLNITLTVIDREPDRTIGRFIQDEWRRLGIETKIDLVSPSTPDNVQRTVLRPRAYEALLYTIGYGATYDPYAFWHSSQRVDPGLNLSLFSNHEADAAIERGRRATNDEIEKQAYTELQKIISNEVPAVFLFTPVRRYAVSNKVKGLNFNEIATPADRFNGLNKWYVKTKIRFKW